MSPEEGKIPSREIWDAELEEICCRPEVVPSLREAVDSIVQHPEKVLMGFVEFEFRNGEVRQKRHHKLTKGERKKPMSVAESLG